MTTQKLMLYFPISETEKPIVYHLVKDFDLMVNIFRAKVTPEEEGYLVLDITGEEENIKKARIYLHEFNVTINDSGRGLQWNESMCTSCGTCIVHCPSSALYFKDRKSMKVNFDINKCIDCLSCVANCPFGVCTSLFCN